MDVYVYESVYVMSTFTFCERVIKMVTANQEQPVYDKRVHEILRALAAGRTREELAKEAGNSNWKTIDMYMRRRHFSWDSQKQTYTPKVEPIVHELSTDSSKAGHVISLLSKEGADAKIVAERLGFRDNRELAEYMHIRGYVWGSKENNYVKQVGEVIVPLDDEQLETPLKINSLDMSNHSEASNINTDRMNLEFYLPLLAMLDKHQDRLLDLIVPSSSTGTIPRFIVPGVAKTKTVQMMHPLEQLVVDFSREKNISQRELFEVALIEFFQRYGYEHEINRLLNR